MLEELGGNFSNLSEAGAAILELSNHVDRIIDSIDSIIENDSSSVVGLSVAFSGIIDKAKVSFDSDKDVVSGGKGRLSLSL